MKVSRYRRHPVRLGPTAWLIGAARRWEWIALVLPAASLEHRHGPRLIEQSLHRNRQRSRPTDGDRHPPTQAVSEPTRFGCSG
jgi:hypothetical protein